MNTMETLPQFLQTLAEKYHYPQEDFWLRVTSLSPAAVSPKENVFVIQGIAEWQAATQKLADIHGLTDYLQQEVNPTNEMLLRQLEKYREQIKKKMQVPDDEEEQNAENWLYKARQLKERYFETLLVFLHRNNSYQPLSALTGQYFSQLGWQKKIVQPGELIDGQEDWFRIESLPNTAPERGGRIKEVEIAPYYIVYAGEGQKETFIFPGKAYVYAK